MSAVGLPLFFYSIKKTGDLVQAQTLLFTFLVLVEFIRIQTIRERYKQSILSNYWLLGALGGSMLLQLAVLYTPLQSIFEVAYIGLQGWKLILISATGFLTGVLGMDQVFNYVFGD
jgi:Ca2+-transporting ATPase